MQSKFQTVARRERKQTETVQLEKCVRIWLSEVFNKPMPDDLIPFLKNGIALCELANIIQPGSVPPSMVRPVPAQTSPFQLARSMDNVRHFLKFLPVLGLPETALFLANDLCEAKEPNKVINCLYNLGRLCSASKNSNLPKMPTPQSLSSSRSANVRSIFGDGSGGSLAAQLEAERKAPWFYKGHLDRPSATILLKANGKPGAFLVYHEKADPVQVSLSMLLPSGLTRQLRIQTLGDQYSLAGTRFASLSKLVEHFSKWALADGQTLDPAAFTGDSAQLLTPSSSGDGSAKHSVLGDDDEADIRRQINSAKEVEESANKLKRMLTSKPSRSPADNKQLETLETTLAATRAKIQLLEHSLTTVTGTDTYSDASLLNEALAVLDAQQQNVDDDEEGGSPHKFKVRNFLTPKFCDYCSGFIYGLARQGVKCRNCGFVSHKRCKEHVAHNCLSGCGASSFAAPLSPVDSDMSDTESLASVDEFEPEDAPDQTTMGKTMEKLMRDFWAKNAGSDTVPFGKFARLLELAFLRIDRFEVERRFKSLSDEELSSLNYDQFVMFYRLLFVTPHVQGLFNAYATSNPGEFMTLAEFQTLLAVEQKMKTEEVSRILNIVNTMPVEQSCADESLIVSPDTAISAIEDRGKVDEYQASPPSAVRKAVLSNEKGVWHEGHAIFGPALGITAERNITLGGLLNFLWSDLNSAFNPSHATIYQNMDLPLSHYYINSSHNTYLEGDQLRSNSTAEAYIKTLLSGCRCVELDLWEGKDGPIIYHGHTLTSKVPAKDVVEAIAKYAFVASDFPVILSLENHLGVSQQRIFVQYCYDAFGDLLVHSAKDNFWDTNPTQLPSPSALKRKILLKNKAHSTRGNAADANNGDEEGESGGNDESSAQAPALSNRASVVLSNTPSVTSLSPSESTRDKKRSLKVAKEMSDVVVYNRSVQFQSFEHAKKTNKCYDMSSFAEKRARKLARSAPAKFTYHTSKFLLRTYPDGMRFDSSNYSPIEFWNYGAHMAALNFQTPDRPMQLNEGRFQQNGNCGYVLKPKFMREMIDPEENATPIDPSHPTTVTIELLSGHQLPRIRRQRRRMLDPYVEVELTGHPSDERKFSSSTVFKNGFNPQWDEAFEFEIRFPELAMLRFVVIDEAIGPKEIVGQFSLPLESLQQGLRTVPLKHPVPFGKFETAACASLLVKFTIQD